MNMHLVCTKPWIYVLYVKSPEVVLIALNINEYSFHNYSHHINRLIDNLNCRTTKESLLGQFNFPDGIWRAYTIH